MTFYDGRPWKVKWNSGPPRHLLHLLFWPRGTEFMLIFAVDQVYVDPYDPNLLIFATWQAISEIRYILWWATKKWPWKLKWNSGPPDTNYTYYIHLNFAYLCSMTSRFWDKWGHYTCYIDPEEPNLCIFLLYDKPFPRRDLEMTLKGQM